MKKFFRYTLRITHCALLIAFLTATAHAAEPVRIARLPIIFLSAIPDEETGAILETKIERALHIPLNGTLQLAEYLPPENSAQLMNDLWQEVQAGNKHAKISEVIRPLARELDADIIVCPVLHEYRQFVYGFSSWCGETLLNSYARVELIVYDRRTDELLDKTTSRMHRDTFIRTGTASYLAQNCLDKLIEQTNLRQLIRDIK